MEVRAVTQCERGFPHPSDRAATGPEARPDASVAGAIPAAAP